MGTGATNVRWESPFTIEAPDMKLAIAAIALAVLAGLALGGTFSSLGTARIRLAVLAVVGLGLQVVPAPGRTVPLLLLYVSFAVLFAFGLVNRRLPGIALILLGILLNFTVIAANGGMPVTRSALIASGQQDTLALLIQDGGAKHHLATANDVLMPLADVIPVRGVDQVVSVGDIATYAGVIWLVVASMRRRSRKVERNVRRAPVNAERVRVGG